ncbi:hypothetical protein FMUND_15302 [Fusarium mundagurra]|uniref:Uncharacterized protein n=1 Tax=Fusarium mundagurra TaxID=1567541 RepID=A0A8H5XPX6_9HYPO|nr:hypothetical protein FMUND_15302 [Fusarium mundagurra]
MDDAHHPSMESSPKARLSQTVKSPPERSLRPSRPASTAAADELPQRLLEFKRKCRTGDYTPLAKFHLSKADYTRLHDKLEATFDASTTTLAIKVVLGIDLNEDKESTISFWKATFTPLQNGDGVEMDIEQVVQSEPFRDANKNPVDGTLTLHLHDFVPDNLWPNGTNCYETETKVPASSKRVVRKRRLSESSEDRIKAR